MSTTSAKPVLRKAVALFLQEPPVQRAFRAIDLTAQIGDGFGVTRSLSQLLLNIDTLAALLLVTAPCLEGLFTACQQETPVLQGGAEHSACAMLLLHIADSNRAAAHSMPGSQQRSSFAHSPWLSSVLSQQQPATVMSARAHLHHQYSATAAATGLDPGQDSSCPWLSGRWILAGRGAAALRAALCTVHVKETMDVAEILPEMTLSCSVLALSVDIMGWANMLTQEEQLRETGGPCLPHAPLLHAQLLAGHSYRACTFLVPDDSTQLDQSLHQKCLDVFQRAFLPIADAALVPLPGPPLCTSSPVASSISTRGARTVQGSVPEVACGSKASRSHTSHTRHAGSTPSAQAGLSSAAVSTSTPKLLLDLRGLISSCVRSLSCLLAQYDLYLGAMHAVEHAAALLQHLHLGLPCPVSDPAPALRLPAGDSATQRRREGQGQSNRGSARAGHANRSTSSSCPTRYMQGHLWNPDTYSLGPAGLVGLLHVLLKRLILNVPQLTAEACLSSLTIIASMIPLAAAMTEEAAQPTFRAQLAAEAATVRAFCDTCEHMLSAACDALYVVSQVGSEQEQLKSQQSAGSGAGEQQGGQGPGVQAGVASVSTASESSINPVVGQDTASVEQHTKGSPPLVHPEGSAATSATLHPPPCSFPSAIIKQDTAIGGDCSEQSCDSARVRTASAEEPSNAPDVASQAQGQVPVSCGLDHSTDEASASNPPASGTVPVKDDQPCELIRNDGAQETQSAASNDEAGEQPMLDAPGHCTLQAAPLLPVLAASALQLIHLTSTCAWHAQQAFKAPECQHLLSVSQNAMWSLAQMEVALIRCIRSLLGLGEGACWVDTSPDAAAVSTSYTSQQQPLASHQVCRQQGYPPDGDQSACDAVAGPISTQQESGSASEQVASTAGGPVGNNTLNKACQQQTCDLPSTEQRPNTGSSHNYTPASVFKQLLPSLGRQCVGVCIASHLSGVCGGVLAALLAACSADAPRPSSSAGARARQQQDHTHVQHDGGHSHRSKHASTGARQAAAAAAVHDTSAVARREPADYVTEQDLLRLTEAMACLADVVYLVQGDLQSWMGSALGAHIRYDAQQLWMSLGPMLGLEFASAHQAGRQPGDRLQLAGVLSMSSTVLPVMILALKAAHAQPASCAHLSSEPASTSPSSSGQAMQGGKQHLHGRGQSSRADTTTTTTSSSSAAATSNTAAAALPVFASSRKSGSTAVAGKSKGLRVQLWEALNQHNDLFVYLLELADYAQDNSLSTCLQRMCAVCIEQLAPPCAVCGALNPSGTLGALKAAGADATKAPPAASPSQPLTSASDLGSSSDLITKVIHHHLQPHLAEVYKGGGPGRWWRAHAKQLAKYTQRQAQAAAGHLDPRDAANMWGALALAQSPA